MPVFPWPLDLNVLGDLKREDPNLWLDSKIMSGVALYGFLQFLPIVTACCWLTFLMSNEDLLPLPPVRVNEANF